MKKTIFFLALVFGGMICYGQYSSGLKLKLISLYENGFMESALTYLEKDAIDPSMNSVEAYKESFSTRDWDVLKKNIHQLRLQHPSLYQDCEVLVDMMIRQTPKEELQKRFEDSSLPSSDALIVYTIFNSSNLKTDMSLQRMLTDYLFVSAVQDYYLCLYSSQFLLIKQLEDALLSGEATSRAE